MPAQRKKPVSQKPPVDDDQQPQDDQDQTDDDEEEDTASEPEAPEHVRAFAATVRNHAKTHKKPFEPVRGVTLMYGYNGLLRVHGPVHVHVGTADEVAEMSDQALYDAVMAAAARKKL